MSEFELTTANECANSVRPANKSANSVVRPTSPPDCATRRAKVLPIVSLIWRVVCQRVSRSVSSSYYQRHKEQRRAYQREFMRKRRAKERAELLQRRIEAFQKAMEAQKKGLVIEKKAP